MNIEFTADEYRHMLTWYNLLFASGRPKKITHKPNDWEFVLKQKILWMYFQKIDEKCERLGISEDDFDDENEL